MVGCPHRDDGDRIRPSAGPAHHGGRGDDAGAETTGLLDAAGRAVQERVGQAFHEREGERDALAKRVPEQQLLGDLPDAGGLPPPSGQVKSYDTEGGRVVFDIGSAYATLVSATPNTSWSMQVWKTESWIRVEFSSGADRVSVFCTWHDGPPHVEIGTY